jgi:hypothetical protein
LSPVFRVFSANWPCISRVFLLFDPVFTLFLVILGDWQVYHKKKIQWQTPRGAPPDTVAIGTMVSTRNAASAAVEKMKKPRRAKKAAAKSVHFEPSEAEPAPPETFASVTARGRRPAAKSRESDVVRKEAGRVRACLPHAVD